MHTSINPNIEKTDLTEGNIWTSIWKMSWPMTLIMLFQFFMGIVDIYVAGLLGADVQASVGFSMQVFFVLSVFANAIGIGVLSLISRAAGKGITERVIEIARQGIFCTFVLSLFITLILIFFADKIVATANLPIQISILSIDMLKYFAIALANNYVIIMANAIFRARGEAKQSLFILVSMNIINILLLFPVVFGIGNFKGLGAIGLPVSMIVSTYWGVALCLYMFTKKQWHGFYNKKITLIKKDIKDIFFIGWPNAITQIAWHSGTIALMSILGKLGSDSVIAIAAMTNGLRIEAIIYLPAFALNMSASVLIGQCIGAGNKKRAEKTGWLIAYTGVIIVTILSIIIFIFSAFIAQKITSDINVQQEIVRYLWFNLPIEPLMAIGVILGGAMQGAGDTKGVMKIIIACMWIIRVPLAWVLIEIFKWGASGVWTAMIVSMVFQGTFMAMRFKSGKWFKSQE
ncbi:MAG TPA: MATE family efflux transporter [Nitrospirae bacterium]|nr:MATE family efflux transporter [Nitrospirota bacterium]